MVLEHAVLEVIPGREDDFEGFRGSAAYEDWRRLLHHFYDPFPTVEHYRQVGDGRSDREALG